MLTGFAAGIARLTTRLAPADAGEVYTLQLAAWVREGRANETLDIPPLQEELSDVVDSLADPAITTWGYRGYRGYRGYGAPRPAVSSGSDDAEVPAGSAQPGRLLAMVRTSLRDAGRTAFIGRLGVVPDLRGQGYGGAMLAVAETRVPDAVERFELITGARSLANHGLYRHHGYQAVDDPAGPPDTVTFRKARVANR